MQAPSPHVQEQLRNPYFAKKPCKFWVEAGRCRDGDACKYMHEARQPPRQGMPPPRRTPPPRAQSPEAKRRRIAERSASTLSPLSPLEGATAHPEGSTRGAGSAHSRASGGDDPLDDSASISDDSVDGIAEDFLSEDSPVPEGRDTPKGGGRHGSEGRSSRGAAPPSEPSGDTAPRTVDPVQPGPDQTRVGHGEAVLCGDAVG